MEQANKISYISMYCLCKVKYVSSKSSWREFFFQFVQLLSTLASPPRNLQRKSLNFPESNFDSAKSNSWFRGLKIKIPQA